MLKQSYITDMSAIKFGIEEEDIVRNPSFLTSEKVAEVHSQLQSYMASEI